MDSTMDLDPPSQFEAEDPLDWSVGQVVAALCDRSSPWLRVNANTVFPDLNALSNRLRENEVNGLALLTSINDRALRKHFGLNVLGHRALIYQAIRGLRAGSLKYQEKEAKIDQDPPLRTVDAASCRPSSLMRSFGVFPPDQPAPPKGSRALDHSSTTQLTNSSSFVATPVAAEAARSGSENQERVASDSASKLLPSSYSGAPPKGDFPIVNNKVEGRVTINGKERRRLAPTLVSQPLPDDSVSASSPFFDVARTVLVNGKERKRLAPTLITITPGNNADSTLTDVFQGPKEIVTDGTNSEGRKWLTASVPKPIVSKALKGRNHESTEGYLGSKRLSVDDLFFRNVKIGRELESEDEGDNFVIKPTGQKLNGQRLYVHKVLKHYLFQPTRVAFLRNGVAHHALQPYSAKVLEMLPTYRKQSFLLFFPAAQRVRVRREDIAKWPVVSTDGNLLGETMAEEGVVSHPSPTDDDNDNHEWDYLLKWQHAGSDIIPARLGESGSEGGYDTDTWLEIEEEQGPPDQAIVKAHRGALSPEEVHKAIDEGIDELVSKWKRTKLPKRELGAFNIWMKSRREGNKRSLIREAQQRIDQINEMRLAKMRKEIVTEIWTKPAQIRKQCRIMEQSIFDREDLSWKILVLERKVTPERPPPQSRKERGVKTKTCRSSDEDEDVEVLGSDTGYDYEDDPDNFIVDDLIDGKIQEATDTLRGDIEVADASGPDSDEDIVTPRKRQKLSPKAGYSLRKDYIGVGHENHNRMHDLPMPAADSSTLLIAAASMSPISARFQSSPIADNLSRVQPTRPIPSQRASGGVIDLTNSDPPDLPSLQEFSNPFLDKNIPFDPTLAMDTTQKSREKNAVPPNAEVINVSDTDSAGSVIFSVVGSRPIEAYMRARDRKRLVAWIIQYMDDEHRESMARRLLSTSREKLRKEMVNGATKLIEKRQMGKKFHTVPSEEHLEYMRLARLFVCWLECWPIKEDEEPSAKSLENAMNGRKKFYRFRRFLRAAMRHNEPELFENISIEEETDPQASSSPVSTRKSKKRNGDAVPDDSGSASMGDVNTIRGRHKRKRPVLENLKARNIRESDRQRLREQEARAAQLNKRLLLQRGLASDKDQPRIVVNNSKFDDQAFVYLNGYIGRRIKPHQTEGLQFIWREIVTDFTSLQGCLLAHSMGLGKTMQVISFLVTLAEASRSEDEEVLKLIPEHLRQSRTLILCPPSLIDNWVDEFLIWTPRPTEKNIGQLRKVDSSIPTAGQRLAEIHFWFDEGGVLLLSYERFRDYILNKGTQAKRPPLNPEDHERIKKELLEGPNIIVADEAHKMRNPTSGIAGAAALFNSKSRIALTGSPLANNLEEYHSMINWVAPDYLGPLLEFRAKYVEPIQEGLYFDSSKNERRRAGKMLRVLKQDLAPKIHRADITVLKGSLPQKYEFVIKFPLTAIQKDAYKLYISKISRGNDDLGNTRLWDWLAILSLLCNHPRCYKDKLQDRAQTDRGPKPPQQEIVAVPSSDEDQIDDAVVSTQLAVDEIVPGDAPVAKMGLTPSTIQELIAVFDQLGSELDSIEISNKTKIFIEILDASKKAGDKVLVFSHSIPTLDYLELVLTNTHRRYSRLDGRTKMTDRQKATKAFNTNGIDIYLVSTRAGGLGLNLYGASRVIIFDFNFNPTWEEQAVGRAYRIGQTKPVYVYRFICAGTFEELIHNKAVFKLQLAVRVVDKKNPAAYATKKAREYLFEPKDVEQKDVSQFYGQDPKVLDKILANHTDDDCITSIEPTETFERDEGEILTAEDEKEADQLLEDERLKRKDPAAYAKLIIQRQLEAAQAVVKKTPIPVPTKQTPIPLPPHLSVDSATTTPVTAPMKTPTAPRVVPKKVNPSAAKPPSTLSAASSNDAKLLPTAEKETPVPRKSLSVPRETQVKTEKTSFVPRKSHSGSTTPRAGSVSNMSKPKVAPRKTTSQTVNSSSATSKNKSGTPLSGNKAARGSSTGTTPSIGASPLSSGTEDGIVDFRETIDLTGDD